MAQSLPECLSAAFARAHFPSYFEKYGPPDPKRVLFSHDGNVWQSIYDWNPTAMKLKCSFSDAEKARPPKAGVTSGVVTVFFNDYGVANARNLIIVTGGNLFIREIQRDTIYNEHTPTTPSYKDSFSLSSRLPIDSAACNEDELLVHTKFTLFDTYIVPHLEIMNPAIIERKKDTISKQFKGLLNLPQNEESQFYSQKYKIKQDDLKRFNELVLFRYDGPADKWQSEISKPGVILSSKPSDVDKENWIWEYDPRPATLETHAPGAWQENDKLIAAHGRGSLHFQISCMMRTGVGIFPSKRVLRLFYHADGGRGSSANDAGLLDSEFGSFGAAATAAAKKKKTAAASVTAGLFADMDDFAPIPVGGAPPHPADESAVEDDEGGSGSGSGRGGKAAPEVPESAPPSPVAAAAAAGKRPAPAAATATATTDDEPPKKKPTPAPAAVAAETTTTAKKAAAAPTPAPKPAAVPAAPKPTAKLNLGALAKPAPAPAPKPAPAK